MPSLATCSTMDFNPRSPRGERRFACSSKLSMPSFQSTLPAWGATMLLHLYATIQVQFQSTLPAWGAT